MTTTFCISGGALKKAGVNVHPSLSAGVIMVSASNFIVDHWINNAENFIVIASNFNYLDSYDTLNVDVKNILTETTEALAAMDCIIFDQGGYTSLTESQTMLNFHRDIANRNIAVLKDKSTTKPFMTGA